MYERQRTVLERCCCETRFESCGRRGRRRAASCRRGGCGAARSSGDARPARSSLKDLDVPSRAASPIVIAATYTAPRQFRFYIAGDRLAVREQSRPASATGERIAAFARGCRHSRAARRQRQAVRSERLARRPTLGTCAGTAPAKQQQHVVVGETGAERVCSSRARLFFAGDKPDERAGPHTSRPIGAR